MKNKTRLSRYLYRKIGKPVFFRHDPEKIHDQMTWFGSLLGRTAVGRLATRALFNYQDPALEQDLLGIHFTNPIGLAAGFDKNGRLANIMPEVGFGFMEIGSVTGEPCAGNAKPRLWRLPKSESLVVHYGLKNDGSAAVARRLQRRQFRLPVGISIAKTNCPATADAQKGIDDYLKAYRAFQDIGQYFTINISCPNTFGGQLFSDKKLLAALLNAIAQEPKTKPIFVKLSPDLSSREIDDIVKISLQHKIDGFICTNLTERRHKLNILDQDIPKNGGISGKLIADRSTELVSQIYRKVHGRAIVIGCGGIFSAEDAYTKIKAGASLIQLITSMIYEGPQLISEINQGLAQLLKEDGFTNIAQAVGTDNNHK